MTITMHPAIESRRPAQNAPEGRCLKIHQLARPTTIGVLLPRSDAIAACVRSTAVFQSARSNAKKAPPAPVRPTMRAPRTWTTVFAVSRRHRVRDGLARSPDGGGVTRRFYRGARPFLALARADLSDALRVWHLERRLGPRGVVEIRHG